MGESAKPGTAIDSWELLLPPVIPAAVGRELPVYFDNLIAGDASRYDFDVEAPVGFHRSDGWVWVPDKAGDYPLTIEVYAEDGERLAAASTVVRVKPNEAKADEAAAAHSASVQRTALFIGDSTTAAGHYTAELLRLFALDPSKRLVLLGTAVGESISTPNTKKVRSFSTGGSISPGTWKSGSGKVLFRPTKATGEY